MQHTQNPQNQARHLHRQRGLGAPVQGVARRSRRTRRRLYLKVQLWMWRRRRERCTFWSFRRKRKAGGTRSGPKTRTDERRPSTGDGVKPSSCDPDALPLSGSRRNRVTDASAPAGAVPQTLSSHGRETFGRCCERAEPSKRSHAVTPPLRTDGEACEERTGATSGQRSAVTRGQDQAADPRSEEGPGGRKLSFPADVSLEALSVHIHGFLDEFCTRYGSLIPLCMSDVLRHLGRKFHVALGDRKGLILSEIRKYRSVRAQKPVPSFQVLYKKHTLTLEDLSTLANQNWLNDQVMNMYGELIVESAHHKVHFLNSFFHRQLVTKGYEGVKRWTKQVDLFSKCLLLVPIHLEVHWCLVTADFLKKKLCLYDSQGMVFKKVARNILRYLMTEAKEKQRTAFENGWTVTFNNNVPQQTNENDCGVFVLEYSRRLALSKPLWFSQADIPKIRKRIYKELCACKLQEEG